MTQNHPDLVTTDPAGLLDRLCVNALRLLNDIPRPPRRLRLRAGAVSVELTWGADEVVAGGELAIAMSSLEAAADPEPAIGYLTAQTVGVFYRAPEPGAAPFIREGDTVVEGQQVGIVEAMKLMIPIEADRAGRISKVLKDDGEPVEYGEPLFAIAAAGCADPARG